MVDPVEISLILVKAAKYIYHPKIKTKKANIPLMCEFAKSGNSAIANTIPAAILAKIHMVSSL